MSNIEPTKEQKQAARDFMGRPVDDDVALSISSGALARLLAEREAKLTTSIMEVWVAERTQSNERYDTLRARVAELEASEPNVLLQRAYSLACNERNALAEREAQHLADIKAAKDALSDVNDDAGSLWPRVRDKVQQAIARLAHYDDAKADAPAVDWQAWANGSCPEPGCSLANPHEQGAACVKPTAEGGEG